MSNKNKVSSSHGMKGRFCCCGSMIGMHFVGLITLGLFSYYMSLFIKSAEADNWNWVILIWTFVIGLPRLIFYFYLFGDSLQKRKMWTMALAVTTAIEFLIYVINQFMIFMHSEDYCHRVYSVYYMVEYWNIDCPWAIFLFELLTTSSLIFYIYASKGAYNHYSVGFHDQHLKAKEKHRMEVNYMSKDGKMKLREQKSLSSHEQTLDGSNTSALLMQQPGMYPQMPPQQQQQMVMGPDGPMMVDMNQQSMMMQPSGMQRQQTQFMMQQQPMAAGQGMQYAPQQFGAQGPQYAPMLADLSQNNISQNNLSQNNVSSNDVSSQLLAQQQPIQTVETAMGSSTERFTDAQPQNSAVAMVPQTRAQDPNDSDLPTSIVEVSLDQPRYMHTSEPIDYSQDELLRQNDKSLGEH